LEVHLPIGFLFFAFILEFFARWKGNKAITAAVPLALLLGAISALVACILGYMLSLSGDYEQGALDTHFWFGVGTTAISFLAWLISADKLKIPNLNQGKPYMATLTLIVILLSVTGHYGGNLTHGSDYLTAYLPFGKEDEDKSVAVTSVEEAQIFDHLVQPILDNKCASCHNASKKKGQLSFATADAITKGGKSGPSFMAGDPSQSEMIKRVLLDPHDEKFMPPEGKTPLTKEEIAIIEHWIKNAQGDFEITFGNVEADSAIKEEAARMLGLDPGSAERKTLASVAAPSETDMSTLINAGFKIRELVAASNLYDVALPADMKGITPEKISDMMSQLIKIDKNIVWLSLPSNQIKDEHLEVIATFQNLKKLRLEKNPITDKGIGYLTSLQNLESLNVYQTDITNTSIHTFNEMKNLKKVYVWGTGIKPEKLSEVSQKDTPDLIM